MAMYRNMGALDPSSPQNIEGSQARFMGIEFGDVDLPLAALLHRRSCACQQRTLLWKRGR